MYGIALTTLLAPLASFGFAVLGLVLIATQILLVTTLADGCVTGGFFTALGLAMAYVGSFGGPIGAVLGGIIGVIATLFGANASTTPVSQCP